MLYSPGLLRTVASRKAAHTASSSTQRQQGQKERRGSVGAETSSPHYVPRGMQGQHTRSMFSSAKHESDFSDSETDSDFRVDAQRDQSGSGAIGAKGDGKEPQSSPQQLQDRIHHTFMLPPPLIVCLVRHVDKNFQQVATPACVEKCVQELQRYFEKPIPTESICGGTGGTLVIGRGSNVTTAPAATVSPVCFPGSCISFQLGKSLNVYSTNGAAILNIFLYSVDEPVSKPRALAHIAKEWRDELAKTGSENSCLILLYQRDLVAAAEMSQAIQDGEKSVETTLPRQSAVSAAAVKLEQYFTELKALKFTAQEMCAYLPNEAPMRVMERLRAGCEERTRKIKDVYREYLAKKRVIPLDPRQRFCSSPSPESEAVPPASSSQAWSIQQLWRHGYDLCLHYLHFGQLEAARDIFEELYLEYYNNSDDYAFVTSPYTLQRLGQVSGLFEPRGRPGCELLPSGYPRALGQGPELVDGLLYIASCEIASDLLLDRHDAARRRYDTFIELCTEKFEELAPEVAPRVYQHFFLLQCALSGLRTFWPSYGLCKPFFMPPQLSTGSGGMDCEAARDAEADKNKGGRAVFPLDAPVVGDEAQGIEVSPPLSLEGGGALGKGRDEEVAVSNQSMSAPVASSSAAFHFSMICPPENNVPQSTIVATSQQIDREVSGTSISCEAERDRIVPPWSESVDLDPCASEENARDQQYDFVDDFVQQQQYQEEDDDHDGQQDTLQALSRAVISLVRMAQATGLIPVHSRPIKMCPHGYVSDRESIIISNAPAQLQKRVESLRAYCAELSSLANNARDSLVWLLMALGYTKTSAVLRAAERKKKEEEEEQHQRQQSQSQQESLPSGAVEFFQHSAELASAASALRFWRLLTSMTAAALRVARQRRREFNLYTRVALTYLQDDPGTAARLSARKLIPFSRVHGWWHLELFTCRLYVESIDRLIHQHVTPVEKGDTGRDEGKGGMTWYNSKTWRKVFENEGSYKLYKECILFIIGSGYRECDPYDHTHKLPGASNVGCVVGTLDDDYVFAHKSQEDWWAEMARVDKCVVPLLFSGKPVEMPMDFLLRHPRLQAKLGGLHSEATDFSQPSASTNTEADTGGRCYSSMETARMPLRVHLDETVALRFTAECPISIISPFQRDGVIRAQHGGTSDQGSALHVSLLLESHKDWEDEMEPTHVVTLISPAELTYDASSQSLAVSFIFKACHAGMYRMRCIQFRIGATLLSHYPLPLLSPEEAAEAESFLVMYGNPTCSSSAAASPLSTMYHKSNVPCSSAGENARHLECGRMLFCVPEPNSGIHLSVSLPPVEHCFADAVTYFTLNVAMETPLSATMIDAFRPRQEIGVVSPSSATPTTGSTAPKGGETSTGERNKSKKDDARYSSSMCIFEASDMVTTAMGTSSASLSQTPVMGALGLPGASLTHMDMCNVSMGGFTPLDSSVLAFVLVTPLRTRELGRGASPSMLAAASTGAQSQRHRRAAGERINGSSFGNTSFTMNTLMRNSMMQRRLLASSATGQALSGFAAGVAGESELYKGSSSSQAYSESVSVEYAGVGIARAGSFAPAVETSSGTRVSPRRSCEKASPNTFAPLSLDLKTTLASMAPLAHAQLPSKRPRNAADDEVVNAKQQLQLPGLEKVDSLTSTTNTVLSVMDGEVPVSVATVSSTTVPPESRQLTAVPTDAAQYSLLSDGGAQAYPTPLSQLLPPPDSVSSSISAARAGGTGAAEYCPSPHGGTTIDEVHMRATLVEDRTAPSTSARTIIPMNETGAMWNLPAPVVAVPPEGESSSQQAPPSLNMHGAISLFPRKECRFQLQLANPGTTSAAAAPALGTKIVSVNNGEGDVAMASVKDMRVQLPLLPLFLSNGGSAASSTLQQQQQQQQLQEPSKVSFTCMRGRESCTTSVTVVLPFSSAMSIEYAFKHFQGRVYCLVKMRNTLKHTSLWMRGAMLHLLDSYSGDGGVTERAQQVASAAHFPSQLNEQQLRGAYDVVRVSEVYEHLLKTEWKPNETIQLLFELALSPHYQPTQAVCQHRVRLQVFYSDWQRTFLATPEDRCLVLVPTEPPPTEIMAEGVRVAGMSDACTPSQRSLSVTNTQNMVTIPPSAVGPHVVAMGSASKRQVQRHNSPSARNSTAVSSSVDCTTRTPNPDNDVASNTSTGGARTAIPGVPESTEGGAPGRRQPGPRPLISTRGCSGTGSEASCNGPQDGDDAMGENSRPSSNTTDHPDPQQAIQQQALRYNALVVNMLSSSCNTYYGAVASFESKHMCLFSAVIYAESPWTTRLGAATNYPAAAAAATNLLSQAVLLGDEMVDQPSKFEFVAGEPVRFRVHLEPHVQNWPEDADVEEDFFIQFTYDPRQWMVVGKQRERRTLSLMDIVTVSFTAVPLLPLAAPASPWGTGDVTMSAAEECVVQTPSIQMQWAKKHKRATADGEAAVMAEDVLIDVVQFRSWVHVCKRR